MILVTEAYSDSFILQNERGKLQEIKHTALKEEALQTIVARERQRKITRCY